MNKRAKPGALQVSNVLFKIGEHWVGKYFHYISAVKEGAKGQQCRSNSLARDVNVG
jgi:hypothetical protein